MLDIIQLPILSDNYIYIIHNEVTHETAVVDPGLSDPVLQFLEKKNWSLDYIINTHHHWDHTDGNLEIKSKTGCKIVGYGPDSKRIRGIDILVEDGEEIEICSSKARVLFLPGHTLGHIAYYFESEKKLFSGDVLFAMGCGRLFEGTPQQMFTSLQKLATLPKDVLVYCTHEYSLNNAEFAMTIDGENPELISRYKLIQNMSKNDQPTVPTTIAKELETNPFMRCSDKKIRQNLNAENISNEDLFAKIRSMKDNF